MTTAPWRNHRNKNFVEGPCGATGANRLMAKPRHICEWNICASQIGNLPQNKGEHKKYLKPPTSCTSHHPSTSSISNNENHEQSHHFFGWTTQTPIGLTWLAIYLLKGCNFPSLCEFGPLSSGTWNRPSGLHRWKTDQSLAYFTSARKGSWGKLHLPTSLYTRK